LFSCFYQYSPWITAGFASILNAASPLFGALIGYLWLRDRLTPAQIAGLAIGFAGVVLLAWDKAGLRSSGAAPALTAALIGTVS
jgi:drug/metabolite transporter (DMT)-like permease